MQIPRNGQWWSNVATHREHWLQCLARIGWSIWQAVQYLIAASCTSFSLDGKLGQSESPIGCTITIISSSSAFSLFLLKIDGIELSPELITSFSSCDWFLNTTISSSGSSSILITIEFSSLKLTCSLSEFMHSKLIDPSWERFTISVCLGDDWSWFWLLPWLSALAFVLGLCLYSTLWVVEAAVRWLATDDVCLWWVESLIAKAASDEVRASEYKGMNPGSLKLVIK